MVENTFGLIKILSVSSLGTRSGPASGPTARIHVLPPKDNCAERMAEWTWGSTHLDSHNCLNFWHDLCHSGDLKTFSQKFPVAWNFYPFFRISCHQNVNKNCKTIVTVVKSRDINVTSFCHLICNICYVYSVP